MPHKDDIAPNSQTNKDTCIPINLYRIKHPTVIIKMGIRHSIGAQSLHLLEQIHPISEHNIRNSIGSTERGLLANNSYIIAINTITIIR
ncbi:hypothetical protein MNSC_06240 [Minisyncoccus archaeophilus]